MDFRHYLHPLFNPKTIAVLGASSRPESHGAALWQHLRSAAEFATVYAVNPKYKNIGEDKCWPSLASIKADGFDLAVVVSPPSTYEKVLRSCIQDRVKSILLCGGFSKSELDEKSCAMIAECRMEGICVVGPQSLGFLRPSRGLNASYLPEMPARGNVGLISQSPGLVSTIIEIALGNNAGFSLVIDPGMEQELTTADYLDMLACDPETKAIILYLETVKDPRRLISSIRLASKSKPVILLKGGKTLAASDIIVNNNGVPPENNQIMEKALAKAGAMLINTLKELSYAIKSFSYLREFKQGHVFGIVNSKGLDALLADELSRRGIQLAQTQPAQAKMIAENFNIQYPFANPINLGLEASPETFRELAGTVLSWPNCSALILGFASNPLGPSKKIAKALIPVVKETTKPVVTAWLGSRNLSRVSELLENNGIPSTEDLSGACLYLALNEKSHHFKQIADDILGTPPTMPDEEFTGIRKILQKTKSEKRNLIYEEEAKRILASIGFDTTACMAAGSTGEALDAAKALGYPVAMKIRVDGILSKSDLNGVITGIRNDKELLEAWDALLKRGKSALFEESDLGVVIQKTLSGLNQREVKIGFRSTDLFGPIVYIGVGGFYGALGFSDAYGFAPLTRREALGMISEPGLKRLLSEYKGIPAVNPDMIVDALLKLSQLACAVPALKSLEIDPLLCGPDSMIVLDAHAVLGSRPLQADEKYCHLVFPNRHNIEDRELKNSHGRICIACAEPAHAAAFRDYVESLSDNSRRLRYHGIGSIDAIVLQTLGADPDRTFSVFLIDMKEGTGRIIGEAEFSILPNGRSAEFGISLRDNWQRKGLSAPLMDILEDKARDLGLMELIGYVLKDNDGMYRLMTKRGYIRREDPDDPHVNLFVLELQDSR